MHTAQLAKDVATDSAFAFRSFRRSPGWAFVTLLTIALGVGASTAVFSVADTFLIRPLPYSDASRAYALSLEATRRDIVGLLLRDALGEVALGTGVGLAGAIGVTRFTQTMVYGVHGFEPIAFILAAVAVLLASSVACAGPLFRATRVDPTVAIRGE
jgi:hypothetical protein